jgi:hypothetical protein
VHIAAHKSFLNGLEENEFNLLHALLFTDNNQQPIVHKGRPELPTLYCKSRSLNILYWIHHGDQISFLIYGIVLLFSVMYLTKCFRKDTHM